MAYFTDFELKGKRMYVHSPTLCAYVCETFLQKLNFNGLNTCIDAAFHTPITHNGTMLLRDVKLEQKECHYAAEFKLHSGGETAYVYFKEQDIPVHRRVASSYAVRHFESTGELAATCMVKCDSIKCFMDNLVEANKRIHQVAFSGKRVKVVNVYMKRVPVIFPEGIDWVQLDIQNIGSRTQGSSMITLNRIVINDFQCTPFEMSYLVEWE